MSSAAEAYANALTALWRAETAQDARTNVVSTLSSDVFTLRDIVRHLLNQPTSETAIAGILGILLSPLLRIEDVEEPRTLVGDMLCHVKCAQTLTRVLTVLLDFRDVDGLVDRSIRSPSTEPESDLLLSGSKRRASASVEERNKSARVEPREIVSTERDHIYTPIPVRMVMIPAYPVRPQVELFLRARWMPGNNEYTPLAFAPEYLKGYIVAQLDDDYAEDPWFRYGYNSLLDLDFSLPDSEEICVSNYLEVPDMNVRQAPRSRQELASACEACVKNGRICVRLTSPQNGAPRLAIYPVPKEDRKGLDNHLWTSPSYWIPEARSLI